MRSGEARLCSECATQPAKAIWLTANENIVEVTRIYARATRELTRGVTSAERFLT